MLSLKQIFRYEHCHKQSSLARAAGVQGAPANVCEWWPPRYQPQGLENNNTECWIALGNVISVYKFAFPLHFMLDEKCKHTALKNTQKLSVL